MYATTETELLNLFIVSNDELVNCYQSFDCCMDNSSVVIHGKYDPDWYKRDSPCHTRLYEHIYEGNDYTYCAAG